ncbi:MAG: ACP S-malonyltransferase [Deltaproteobacteria bacterium]|nr:ACP S-malonyltransferase [Deltaproteobacteria bacterium]
MSVALVFPGQGALSVRMGRELARHVPAARAVFDLVDASPAGDARPLSSLPYDGPRSELTPTTNTQPAILAIGVVCLRAPSAGRATEASDV